MICSLVSGAVPGLTQYYVDVKHNNEMGSSVVKEWQPLLVLKMLIVQTMHSRSFGGKMKKLTVHNGLEQSSSCSLFLVLTGGDASAMM
jgi:hypothetical protein